VQISQLLSIEQGYQAVMDFLAATEVGKFPPKSMTAQSRSRCRGCIRYGGRLVWSLYPFFCVSFLSSPSVQVIMISFQSLNFTYASVDEGYRAESSAI